MHPDPDGTAGLVEPTSKLYITHSPAAPSQPRLVINVLQHERVSGTRVAISGLPSAQRCRADPRALPPRDDEARVAIGDISALTA